jgi:hypothetical protein
LIEVMVSQAIALIVLTALLALVVAMVSKLQSESVASDAQVRLRQTSHLLLRDTQGVGSSSGAGAGDFYFVKDGGVSAADEFTVFKRDEAVCGGGVAVTKNDGVTVEAKDIDTDPTATTDMECPLGLAGCSAADIAGVASLIVGTTTSVSLLGGTSGASCKFTFPTGSQATDATSAYNARFGSSESNLGGVLSDVFGAGGTGQVLFGSSFTYRVQGTVLQRSTNGGASFADVLDNVLDLQVERVYRNTDGTLCIVSRTTGVAHSCIEDNFLGLRLGVVTFATGQDGLSVPPPATFANRTHSTAANGRRHRASVVFSASRNRTGA